MNERIIPFTTLQRVCVPVGPLPRTVTVRRWADRLGIRYNHDGRGGIWTTLDALNAAIGLGVAADKSQKMEDLI
ncbi:hypothetical protein [Lysobacter sp. CA199]|uniref:hypothetical protein n=1 Tax=Lysobacter sp. CA199 TaxID=3455608 RepID=UPI003F8D1B57